MALQLPQEESQIDTWRGMLRTLPLEYRTPDDHADSYKGAGHFKHQCKQLEDFLKSLNDKEAIFDVDQLKLMKNFVHEVHSVYTQEFTTGTGNKVTSDMQGFLKMAPELEKFLQNWVDQFDSPSHPSSSPTGTCNGPKEGSDKTLGTLPEKREHKEGTEAAPAEASPCQGQGETVTMNITKNSVSAGFQSCKVGVTPGKIQVSNQKNSEVDSKLKETQEKMQRLERDLEKSAKGEKEARNKLEELQRKLEDRNTALKEKTIELETLQTHLAAEAKSNEGILKHREDVINDLEQRLETAVKEKDSYLMRLSKEMGAKVSSDESHMENISIKYRPMTVADDYHQLFSDAWTEAKQKLDDEVPAMEEVEKLKLLCRILKVSYEEVERVHTECKGSVFDNLVSLTGGAETTTRKKEEKNVGDCLPTAVKNHVADMFRMISGSVSFPQIVQHVESRLKGSGEQECPEAVFKDKMLHPYITEASIFAWKMIVQRPPMTYDDTGTGERHDGGKRQTVQYGSSDPDKPGAVVQTYVFPCLYHGESMMVKGTVFI